MKPLTGDDGVDSTSEIVDPAVTPRRKLLSTRQALVVSSVASLVALVIEMKSLMVIPMTGTFIREVGLTPFAAGWILLSTQLVGVATTGLLARMGDVVGHRKILLYVLLGQLVGNALTGLAVDTVMVIVGRGLVGLSAATALLLAVMRDWMGPKELRQGIGFISGIQGIGVSISFLFGGFFLAAGFSWRSVFLICAVLSLLCLLTVWKWVPETVSRARVKLDYIGAVGLGVWLCLLLVAISKSTSWGLFSVETIGCLVGTAVICALWIFHERRHPEPLVNISVAFGPRLLPAFISTATMAFAAFICYIGITNFVQVPREVAGYGFGYTVLQGGLVLLPGATIIGLMSMVTGRLVGRFGARMLMTAGSLVMSLTFFFWYWNHAEVWQLVVGASIWGFGLAVVFAGGFTVATVEAPAGSTGITNGVLMVWSAIGGAVGTALSTALTSAELIPGTPTSVESGWSNTFLAGAVVTLVGAAVSLLIPRGVGKSIGADMPGVGTH